MFKKHHHFVVCVFFSLTTAMRLRNILRTQHTPRPFQNETSGLTRTESTMLATPVLNGRRGVRVDGQGESKRPSDNGRHLFIHYPTSGSSSPTLQTKQQQQQQQQQQQPSPSCSL